MRLTHLQRLPDAPTSGRLNRGFTPSGTAWLHPVWTNCERGRHRGSALGPAGAGLAGPQALPRGAGPACIPTSTPILNPASDPPKPHTTPDCCYDAAAPRKDTVIYTDLPEGALPPRRCGNKPGMQGRLNAGGGGSRGDCLVPPGREHTRIRDMEGARERSAWPAAFAAAALDACVRAAPAARAALLRGGGRSGGGADDGGGGADDGGGDAGAAALVANKTTPEVARLLLPAPPGGAAAPGVRRAAVAELRRRVWRKGHKLEVARDVFAAADPGALLDGLLGFLAPFAGARGEAAGIGAAGGAAAAAALADKPELGPEAATAAGGPPAEAGAAGAPAGLLAGEADAESEAEAEAEAAADAAARAVDLAEGVAIMRQRERVAGHPGLLAALAAIVVAAAPSPAARGAAGPPAAGGNAVSGPAAVRLAAAAARAAAALAVGDNTVVGRGRPTRDALRAAPGLVCALARILGAARGEPPGRKATGAGGAAAPAQGHVSRPRRPEPGPPALPLPDAAALLLARLAVESARGEEGAGAPAVAAALRAGGTARCRGECGSGRAARAAAAALACLQERGATPQVRQAAQRLAALLDADGGAREPADA
jgi:hypothetical protein